MKRIYKYAAKKEQMASDKEIQMIMSLTGVDEKTAEEAYMRYEDVTEAIDALLEKPVVSGEKYIPAKPKVNTGMTEEQEERCKKGRWLQDQVNAVFSVAHSKTRTLPDELAPEASTEPPSIDLPVAAGASQSQPDGLERTTLPTQQSETLP
jgi:hypothetical protein